MTKRVQRVRHDNAGAQLFLGKLGEITVNTGNKSAHVHDGVNAGGTEQARADLDNVSVATTSKAGKMSTSQVATLNASAAAASPSTADNLAELDANGNVVDSGIVTAEVVHFPSGTRMVFQQTAAPAGWTKDTSHNNKAFRVVSGTVGSGGSVDFSTVFGRTATDGHTLTTAQLAAHSHSGSAVSNGAHTHNIQFTLGVASSNSLDGRAATGDAASRSGYVDSNGAHTHNLSINNAGSGNAHTHNINLQVKYVDLIIAEKD